MQVPNKRADGFVKLAQQYVNHGGDTIKAELGVRRVANADGSEQVQISMMVVTCHAVSNMHRRMSSQIEMTPTEASALIAALSKPWNEQAENQKVKP